MMEIEGEDFNISVDFTINDTDYYDFIPYSVRPETYIVPVVFLIILIVGVVGNGILILILLRHAHMRNVPNTYVLSLALGDLLVIVVSVPFTSILYTFDTWLWGLTVCKLSEFAKDISIGVSVFTLAALSAERYYAVVNPIRRHMAGLRAKPLAIVTALLIWVLAVILAMPAVLFSYLKMIVLANNYSYLVCDPFPEEFGTYYPKGIVLFRFLAYYAIPLCVIAGFYLGMARNLELSTRNMPGELPGSGHQLGQIRARRKVSKMVVSFVIIFIICFLPYHTYMLWFHFCPSSHQDYNEYWHAFRIIGFCLSFINSCVNPIALYFISSTFRKSFNEYLCCCVSPCAVCEERSRTERSRREGNRDNCYSQRGRNGLRGTIYEATFSTTFRRHTQEFNSTGLFEMGSIDTTKPTINKSELPL